MAADGIFHSSNSCRPGNVLTNIVYNEMYFEIDVH